MSEIKQWTVYLLQRTDKIFDGTDVYIGSTSRTPGQRLSSHRRDATRVGNENNKFYKRMREVGVDKWEITPLLSKICDKNTIRMAEREKCNELNADLNTRSPITTPEEKEERKRQYMTDYHEKNTENKKYHCAICEVACGSNKDLQKHLKTPKHFWKYIYSVD